MVETSYPQLPMWKTYPHFPCFSRIKNVVFLKILLFCGNPQKIIHNFEKNGVENPILSTLSTKAIHCIFGINAYFRGVFDNFPRKNGGKSDSFPHFSQAKNFEL